MPDGTSVAQPSTDKVRRQDGLPHRMYSEPLRLFLGIVVDVAHSIRSRQRGRGKEKNGGKLPPAVGTSDGPPPEPIPVVSSLASQGGRRAIANVASGLFCAATCKPWHGVGFDREIR